MARNGGGRRNRRRNNQRRSNTFNISTRSIIAISLCILFAAWGVAFTVLSSQHKHKGQADVNSENKSHVQHKGQADVNSENESHVQHKRQTGVNSENQSLVLDSPATTGGNKSGHRDGNTGNEYLIDSDSADKSRPRDISFGNMSLAYRWSARGERIKRCKYCDACQLKLLKAARLREPVENKKFARFSLLYTKKEEKARETRFAAHQSLLEREQSFIATNSNINCGFVTGTNASSSGFDVDEADSTFMRMCHICILSCIFGNSDRLRSPIGNMLLKVKFQTVDSLGFGGLC